MEIKAPSNAEVFIDELRNAQLQKGCEIANGINDFNTTGLCTGIIRNNDLTKSKNFCLLSSSGLVCVGYMSAAEYGGLAYNCNGGRIAVTCPNKAWVGGVDPSAPDTTYTPSAGICPTDPYGFPLQQTSGNINIPLKCTSTGCINTVWVDYLQVVNPSGQIVETDDAKTFLVEYVDGYKVYVQDDTGTYPSSMTPPTTTSIYVGKVTVPSPGSYCADNDETMRCYLMQRGDTVSVRWPQTPPPITCTVTESVQDHVCHVGSNIPTTGNPHGLALEDLGISADENAQLHQKYFHEKSLVHADPVSTTSALYPWICSAQCVRIEGLLGSPIDERLNIDVNMYKAEDVLYQVPLTGICTCSTFSVDYSSGNFCSPLQPNGCYYFYIDANLPSAPKLLTCTSLPVDMTSIYPIYAVCWCCDSGCCIFSGDSDLRIFKNPAAQPTWNTAGHVCLDCAGRFGFNDETCLFEGYNGTDWLPFHAGCTFYTCETGGASTCYCYAHGLGVRPDVVLIHPLGTTVAPVGSSWEDVSCRTTTKLVVCTSGSAVFEVIAWTPNV